MYFAQATMLQMVFSIPMIDCSLRPNVEYIIPSAIILYPYPFEKPTKCAPFKFLILFMAHRISCWQPTENMCKLQTHKERNKKEKKKKYAERTMDGTFGINSLQKHGHGKCCVFVIVWLVTRSAENLFAAHHHIPQSYRFIRGKCLWFTFWAYFLRFLFCVLISFAVVFVSVETSIASPPTARRSERFPTKRKK